MKSLKNRITFLNTLVIIFFTFYISCHETPVAYFNIKTGEINTKQNQIETIYIEYYNINDTGNKNEFKLDDVRAGSVNLYEHSKVLQNILSSKDYFFHMRIHVKDIGPMFQIDLLTDTVRVVNYNLHLIIE